MFKIWEYIYNSCISIEIELLTHLSLASHKRDIDNIEGDPDQIQQFTLQTTQLALMKIVNKQHLFDTSRIKHKTFF